MNSYERVMAMLNGEKFDVVPAMNFTSVVTKENLINFNIDYSKSHTDAVTMANLSALGHSVLGFDTITPYNHVLSEAAALGANVNWGTSTKPPYLLSYVYDNLEDIVIPSHYMSSKEISSILNAIRLLKKKYDKKVPIIGKVIGPWSIAYNLYGADKLLLDMIIAPQKTKDKIMELSRVSIEFAKAQFKAGADALLWAEHSTRDLISAEGYREFILPMHKNATKELGKDKPLILHICGNLEDRLELILESGFDCLHLDSRNDIQKVAATIGNKCKIVSCVNNPNTLLRGKPITIKKEVAMNLSNKIYAIGPECAIPTNVTNQNLKLLTQLAHSYKP